MADAFRCNGCGEFDEQPFQLVGLEFNTDAIRHCDFTLDDIPTAVFNLAHDPSTGEHTGDFCPECGREALEHLVELFHAEEVTEDR